MKMKKLVSLLLAGAMVFSLAACGGGGDNGGGNAGGGNAGGGDTQAAGGETGSPEDQMAASGVHGAFEDAPNTTKSDETLTVGFGGEPSTIFGAAVANTETYPVIICNAILDQLVSVDQQTGEILPELATEWEWVDDTHCKFTLRDDVTMYDGTPLVADDVVYTVNSIWRDVNQTTDTGRYIDAEGAVADDEHTVTIAFNIAAPDILAMLAWGQFGIVTEDEVNALGGLEASAKNPLLGCGKYRFKEWQTGQSITLERNEEYWNPDYVGYFKEIKFTFTADAASREMAIESGDLDVAYEMPVSQAATYVTNPNVKVVMHSFGQVTHLWFNLGENGNPALQDPNVRKAIDLALDYDALNIVGTAGFGKSNDGYFEVGSKYYNEIYTPEERVLDVDQAKQLLADAGYGDGLELSILGTADIQNVYTAIQGQLQQVGITVNLDIPDTPTFVERAAGGQYDLIEVGDLVPVRYPTIFLSLQKEGAYGFSIGGPKWTTDEIDADIKAAISEPDDQKGKEMFGEIEKQFKDNTTYLNLYTEMHANVLAPDIKGFEYIERGFIDVTTMYK